jgi:RNA:NAD 2'-phosphotransferase (TPT1/KptA family)
MSVSNSNTDETSNSSIKYYDESMVQEASQFIAKLLRHGVDNVDTLVNSRGWMSGKTLRLVLQENFPEVVNTKDLQI